MTGNEIRQARQTLGLSQSELAAALGINKMTLSKWERDERSPGAASEAAIRMLVHMRDHELAGNARVYTDWMER